MSVLYRHLFLRTVLQNKGVILGARERSPQ